MQLLVWSTRNDIRRIIWPNTSCINPTNTHKKLNEVERDIQKERSSEQDRGKNLSARARAVLVYSYTRAAAKSALSLSCHSLIYQSSIIHIACTYTLHKCTRATSLPSPSHTAHISTYRAKEQTRTRVYCAHTRASWLASWRARADALMSSRERVLRRGDMCTQRARGRAHAECRTGGILFFFFCFLAQWPFGSYGLYIRLRPRRKLIVAWKSAERVLLRGIGILKLENNVPRSLDFGAGFGCGACDRNLGGMTVTCDCGERMRGTEFDTLI